MQLIALDAKMMEAETCVLSAGVRILHDRGTGGGWVAGQVVGLDAESGRVQVKFDGDESETCTLARTALMRAPPPTRMRVKDRVRVAFEHEDLPADAMRWQFGSIGTVRPVKTFTNVMTDVWKIMADVHGRSQRTRGSYNGHVEGRTGTWKIINGRVEVVTGTWKDGTK